MALDQDFYAVLGVKWTATRDEIRDAFKRLASQYHPDRNKDEDAARRFKEISEAYFVLSDPAQKRLSIPKLGIPSGLLGAAGCRVWSLAVNSVPAGTRG